jgi:NAD(P)-dependent dehydrogenase (short-subunit alcohol dehydrogenase family)
MSTINVNQVWFITGTSTGFGRAIAEEALTRGDAVVAAARKLEDIADLVSRAPDRVLAVKLDVTRESDIRDAVAAALARFGRIDVLVNSAGYAIVGAVEETPDQELRSQFETNFFGAMTLTRQVLPHMRGKKSGTIVNISSFGGQTTAPGFGAYCATKFALEAMSETLATEVKHLGIRVLVVEPGAFRTSFGGEALRRMPAIDEYATSVGPTRSFAANMHGTQSGNPAKAANTIADILRLKDMPLRLPLGADSIGAIKTHLRTVGEELARWESVGLHTNFDSTGTNG